MNNSGYMSYSRVEVAANARRGVHEAVVYHREWATTKQVQ